MRNIFFSIAGILMLIAGGVLINENEDRKKTSISPGNRISPAFLDAEHAQWADSVFAQLSLDEKIGQLFTVAAYSNKDSVYEASIEHLIREHKVGGVIFFQGTPYAQVRLTNRFQKLSKVPLLIATDAEWGLAMRLDSAHQFPRQMTLGAIQNNDLIYDMGAEIASQCQRIGVHVNLAPVADVNNNPNNPVINVRSFGENKKKVVEKCLSYMNGLQDNNVLATVKHFPGHGDTDSDSHKTLPIIHHDKARLDSLELYPFKKLINNGVAGVMTAHLYIPSLDSTPNKASTLSKDIITDLLQIELGFEGLVYTDALNMRSVSAFYDPGKLDVQALLAGNDVLLFSKDVPKAIEEIKKAIQKGQITEAEIEKRCKKILNAKSWARLSNSSEVDLKNLTQEINPSRAKYLTQQLYENASTLLKNDDNILPLKGLDKRSIVSLNVGDDAKSNSPFTVHADLYCELEEFNFVSNRTDGDINMTIEKLNQYNTVLVNLVNMNQKPYKNFGLDKRSIQLIEALASDSTKQVVLNLNGNPYALSKLNMENIDAVLVSYEDNAITQKTAASIFFGGTPALGRLPVSIGSKFKEGSGIDLNEIIRFKYTMPEELEMRNSDLNEIDKICKQSIKDGVFPGCQILVAKDGKVFYHKGFGNHTYDTTSNTVEKGDIYDLASITKIASSTAALMHLQSQGTINVDSTLDTYLHDMVDSTDYQDIKLKEMLTHQAGFAAWIPFYMRTLHKGEPKIELYSIKQTDFFSQRVANDLYAVPSLRDSIFKRIINQEVSSVKKYKYSDLGYYFINEMIGRISGKTQDEYLDSIYYRKLGLGNIGYNPRNRFDISKIPPTEDDKYFRDQLVHADVHDQGAAMLGGVCGHAGLFANSNDLAVMMQTFLNYGTYGGERFYDESVGKLFTSSPYYSTKRNRRGIGFDKPVRGGGSGPTCSGCAGDDSFGHSGFTGTLTWADPANGMVYVFLSNRVYPDANNRKIISSSVRTRIMQQIYNAIEKGEERQKKVNS